jgi:hypothetical protein
MVAESSHKFQVIEFQYSWARSTPPVWPTLLERSRDLVELLKQDTGGYGVCLRAAYLRLTDYTCVHSFAQLLERPLIMVGHGLGGLIVKQVRHAIENETSQFSLTMIGHHQFI